MCRSSRLPRRASSPWPAPSLATSANEPGGPDPRSLDDVPGRIRAAVAAELDAGPLPGTPSTVIDFTGAEPRVIRDGAVSGADAIARVNAALLG